MASSLVSHRSFLILIFLYCISFHSNHPLSQVLDPIQAIPISAVPSQSANSPAPSPSAPSSSPADNTPSPSPSGPTNAPSSPTNAPSSPTNSNSPSPPPSPSPSPSPGPISSSPTASSNGASPSPSRTGSQSPSPNSPSGSAAPAPSSTVVIITLTRTAADGSLYASLSSTLTPLPHSTSTPGSSSSSGSSSSTWAIIGGIVGGLAALGAVVFIVFRCTQRRFSDLDDEDVAIKWPELVNRADDPSTLNPLAARPALGHGVGEDDDHEDEKPRLYSHDIAMESLHSDQRHPRMYDPYQPYHPPPLHPQEQNAYLDDPYLGPSATQPPYPATVNNLGYDEMGVYQSQPPSRPNDIPPRPSISSTISRANDLRSPSPSQQRAQATHYHDHLQQQYPISWDGPEDIPLTVVNSSSNPTTPSPAQDHHRP